MRLHTPENSILIMENNVLSGAPGAVSRAIDRSLATRRDAARDEVERLIDGAFRVIERTGHLEPKVSEILAEAGLSNQAFYRHFAGKHALLVALLDEGIRTLAEHLTVRMAEASDPEGEIRAWVRGIAAQARDPLSAQASRPFALARGRLATVFPDEVSKSEQRVTAPLRAALERARDSGALPSVLPEPDAEALYHLMMSWVEARLIESRTPAKQEVERLEAFVIGGLRGAPQPQGEA